MRKRLRFVVMGRRSVFGGLGEGKDEKEVLGLGSLLLEMVVGWRRGYR